MAQASGSEHLVIQTAFLGDLLLGIPFFKQLRLLKPNDKITLLCRKGVGEFLKATGLVDEVIEADKSSKDSWSSAVGILRKRKFEILFCPHESFRSLSLAYRLSARRKIAYKSKLGYFVFSDLVQRPLELPEALRQLALLGPLDSIWKKRLEQFRSEQVAPGGQATSSKLVKVPEWASMEIPRLSKIRRDLVERATLDSLSPKSRSLAEELELSSPKILFLAPGSVWSTKMWVASGFSDIARAYLKKNYRVVLMGAPNEVEICNQVLREAPGALSIAGKTSLWESAELLALAELLVCNDSGAMHVAAAAGVKTVSVFGPTVLDFGYRPWQDFASVVEVPKAELPCRPCGKHGALVCPIGTHACMKSVSSDSVLEALQLFDEN